MVDRRTNLKDPIHGESGERGHTAGSSSRNFVEQTIEIWSEEP